jgi:hypothetical protein
VLAKLGDEDARLLRIRHVEMPAAGRERCAAAASLTVEAWRHRYQRAWKRFVAAVAAAEPSHQCRPVRVLVGELDAGTLSNGAAKAARGQVDAHIVECAACRVFARESYRVLVLTPVAPAGCTTLERLVEHGAAVVERNPSEVAAGAGAAAGGAGLLTLFGSGGLATGLKVLAVVCGVSATAAGLCGGVVATYELLTRPAAKQPSHGRATHKPATPQFAGAIATATTVPAVLTVVRTATPGSGATPARRPRARSTASPNSNPPAAVAAGSSGQEFTPAPANSTPAPAPVPAGVQGEFSP